ncbi:MAG: glucose-6-phosphate dehydrogenase [Planctomycetes bacterium]|nr:glucose-6-phosphate dehydrogenase [Planctomycetota bacterium]
MTSPSSSSDTPPADPCLMLLFGASGDLTKRLLTPALLNLVCDGLLPDEFAIIGMAMDDMDDASFRAKLENEIRTYSTRTHFEPERWEWLKQRIHYMPGNFGKKEDFTALLARCNELDVKFQLKGNILVYLAISPTLINLVTSQLDDAGFKERQGWLRIIVEKPFGTDLESARVLSQQLLTRWREKQIYRIDHYLGKETVQNLISFRFANGIFEPLWNKNHIDHIQFSVLETVGAEGRGGYYDKSGVVRDMIQNHMFQMLAYLCMEPPASFDPDAVRNEKGKLVQALRVVRFDEVPEYGVHAQYAPGKKADGSNAIAYRSEPQVDPQSRTETYAAMKLHIDNWRWEGVPIYLRSGKALWKRGTEIVVQFKKAPQVIFRNTPSARLIDNNQLIFHIQPDQAVEFRVQAKKPGPNLVLQKVDMRFDYSEAFEAGRATGYEVLLYSAMLGDTTLFSRSDFVEASWQVVQPFLDYWKAAPASEMPTYPAGSWGPSEAYDMLERDGRRWHEVVNREVLSRVPDFADAPSTFLHSLALMLEPNAVGPGDTIIHKGDMGTEMFYICRGEVEILDGKNQPVARLGEGSSFGEVGLLLDMPRTATVRAIGNCDLFILRRESFRRALKDYPELHAILLERANKRAGLS